MNSFSMNGHIWGFKFAVSKVRATSLGHFTSMLFCPRQTKWINIFYLNGKTLGFYPCTDSKCTSLLGSTIEERKGRISRYRVSPIHSLYCFFFFQIQCSDHSCKVQEFLSQALDPPSPVAGKNSCSCLFSVSLLC